MTTAGSVSASVSAYIGIDVAIARHKNLPIVIAVREGRRLVPLPLRRMRSRPPLGMGNRGVLTRNAARGYAVRAVEYVQEVLSLEGLRPGRVAIDAPSAPCSGTLSCRLSEAALGASGLSYFKTPTAKEFDDIRDKVTAYLASGGDDGHIPYSNKLWMLAGFELFRAFAALTECREVYPQAIAHALGVSGHYKARDGGWLLQLQAAAAHTGWPATDFTVAEVTDIGFGDDHDRADAYLSAWVASLETTELNCYGEPPEDAIWVPNIRGTNPPLSVPGGYSVHMPISPRRTKRNPRSSVSTRTTEHQRTCPACGLHTFRRWPYGWDAHAAHRCSGLAGSDPESRKAEFRAKYLD